MKKAKVTEHIIELKFDKENYYKYLKQIIEYYIMTASVKDENSLYYADKIERIEIKIIEKDSIDSIPINIEVK